MCMRSHPGLFDLSFLLAPGVKRPRSCEMPGGRTSLEVDGPLLRLRGHSREAVFNDAARLMTALNFPNPSAIAGILHTPQRPSGFDRWQIIVGARVAFSPTGLDPYFPPIAPWGPDPLAVA